jgi:2-dehydropantoate 2-reductase
MSIIVLGAGAVGCYVAAKLARAGADVVLIARGPALEAIASGGIAVVGEESFRTEVRTTAIEAAEPAELLIGCLKAHSIPAAAPEIARLLKPHGMWVPIQNGIPWWFCAGTEGPLAGLALDSIDPERAISTRVPLERVAGAVMYVRSEIEAPGTIRYGGGKGIIVGEPGGGISTRVRALADLLNSAGLACSTTDAIRSAVWNKLFGNISLNPLTTITGTTVDRLLAEPRLVAFLVATIEEAQRVATAAGAVPEVEPAARVEMMMPMKGFRTSMLQDADAGRPLELDAILKAPVEIARRLGVLAPGLELLLALTTAIAESRGLRPVATA